MTKSQTSLPGRERRELKSRAKTLPVSVKIGRKGVTETALREMVRSLQQGQGLAKVSFPGDRDQRAAMTLQVEEELGAICIASTGKTGAFYRALKE